MTSSQRPLGSVSFHRWYIIYAMIDTTVWLVPDSKYLHPLLYLFHSSGSNLFLMLVLFQHFLLYRRRSLLDLPGHHPDYHHQQVSQLVVSSNL